MVSSQVALERGALIEVKHWPPSLSICQVKNGHYYAVMISEYKLDIKEAKGETQSTSFCHGSQNHSECHLLT